MYSCTYLPQLFGFAKRIESGLNAIAALKSPSENSKMKSGAQIQGSTQDLSTASGVEDFSSTQEPLFAQDSMFSSDSALSEDEVGNARGGVTAENGNVGYLDSVFGRVDATNPSSMLKKKPFLRKRSKRRRRRSSSMQPFVSLLLL